MSASRVASSISPKISRGTSAGPEAYSVRSGSAVWHPVSTRSTAAHAQNVLNIPASSLRLVCPEAGRGMLEIAGDGEKLRDGKRTRWAALPPGTLSTLL